MGRPAPKKHNDDSDETTNLDDLANFNGSSTDKARFYLGIRDALEDDPVADRLIKRGTVMVRGKEVTYNANHVRNLCGGTHIFSWDDPSPTTVVLAMGAKLTPKKTKAKAKATAKKGEAEDSSDDEEESDDDSDAIFDTAEQRALFALGPNTIETTDQTYFRMILKKIPDKDLRKEYRIKSGKSFREFMRLFKAEVSAEATPENTSVLVARRNNHLLTNLSMPNVSEFNTFKSKLTDLNDPVSGSQKLSEADLASIYYQKVHDISAAVASRLWLEVRITNAVGDHDKTLSAIRTVLSSFQTSDERRALQEQNGSSNAATDTVKDDQAAAKRKQQQDAARAKKPKPDDRPPLVWKESMGACRWCERMGHLHRDCPTNKGKDGAAKLAAAAAAAKKALADDKDGAGNVAGCPGCDADEEEASATADEEFGHALTASGLPVSISLSAVNAANTPAELLKALTGDDVDGAANMAKGGNESKAKLYYCPSAGLFHGTWDAPDNVRTLVEDATSKERTDKKLPTSVTVKTVQAAVTEATRTSGKVLFLGPRPQIGLTVGQPFVIMQAASDGDESPDYSSGSDEEQDNGDGDAAEAPPNAPSPPPQLVQPSESNDDEEDDDSMDAQIWPFIMSQDHPIYRRIVSTHSVHYALSNASGPPGYRLCPPPNMRAQGKGKSLSFTHRYTGVELLPRDIAAKAALWGRISAGSGDGDPSSRDGYARARLEMLPRDTVPPSGLPAAVHASRESIHDLYQLAGFGTATIGGQEFIDLI